MATFIIIPTTGTNDFDSVLPEKFGNKSYRLPKGEWLLAYDGTSRQLSDDLGISESASASALVLNFSAYWGRASKDMWEWLQENGDS